MTAGIVRPTRMVLLAAFASVLLLCTSFPTAWATAEDAAFYPVNSYNGNLVIDQVELEVDPLWPLRLERTFNSRDTREGLLGNGWSSSIDWEVADWGDKFQVVHGDGMREVLKRVPGSNPPTFIGRVDRVQRLDGGGWVLETSALQGHAGRLEFSSDEKLNRISAPGMLDLSVEHNFAGQVSSIRDDFGRSISFSYSGNDHLVSAGTSDGRTVKWIYPDGIRMTGVTDAMGATMHYTYGERDRVVSVIDATGRTVQRMEYDQDGRATRQYDASGDARTETYTLDPPAATLWSPRGFASSYVNDPAGHPVSVTDETSARLTRTYDAAGYRTSYTDPNGHTWYFGVDPDSGQWAMLDPNQQTTTFAYDTSGKLVQVDLPSGGSWRYTYDDLGYPTEISDPWGTTVTIGRDDDHRITSVSNERGQTSRYEYDFFGHLVASFNVDTVQQATYDDRGHVSTFVENGAETTLTYDDDGHLVQMNDASGSTNFSYDAAGWLQQISDHGLGTVDFDFDPRGMLSAVRSAGNQTIGFEYDASRNRTAFTDSRGRTAHFAYDARNFPIQEIDPSGGAWQLAYDANGNLTEAIDPTGKAATFAYRFDNELDSAIERDGTVSYFPADASGYPVSRAVADPFAGGAVAVSSKVGAWEPTLDLRPDAQTTDPIGRIVGALRPLTSISYGADGQFAGWSSQPVDPTSFEARLIARLEMAQRAMRGPDDPSTHAAQLLDPVPDPDTGPRAAD